MEDNKILFVDLDGTLIKEDLSDMAFSHSLKNYPFKTLFYLFIFLFKGKPYLKEKISKNFEIPFANLTFNKAQKRDIKVAMSNTFGFGGHNASIVFSKLD